MLKTIPILNSLSYKLESYPALHSLQQTAADSLLQLSPHVAQHSSAVEALFEK